MTNRWRARSRRTFARAWTSCSIICGARVRAALLAAAKAPQQARPVRFVQIGTIGGAELPLPGAVLRASSITLMGSGLGSIALPRLLNAARAVLGAACEARLRIDTRTVPLADVDAHWGDTGSTLRPVLTMRAPG
ncbi:putative alcohol dehydrogenase, zinc-binding domain protein [Burkholderia pseudomallei]|nr:putative alcohol dehydrogenase, zinc-binding domain protein [Burkholderia pseudomallei]KGV42963.1 putative alcohol dehydrogenase, zinc-binding domain protein [Burkholderia pseudomallei TSV 31]